MLSINGRLVGNGAGGAFVPVNPILKPEQRERMIGPHRVASEVIAVSEALSEAVARAVYTRLHSGSAGPERPAAGSPSTAPATMGER